ncbi:MAG: TraR/DksA C4-type zinc finger protein [Armatimonadota bacterium]
MEALNIEKYRKKLIDEKARVQRMILNMDDDLDYDPDRPGQSELADYDQHPADDGTETFEKEKDISVRDSWRDVMGRIDEALGKIERGTYGCCDRCGVTISKERLNVMPYAIFCVDCQDAIEGR